METYAITYADHFEGKKGGTKKVVGYAAMFKTVKRLKDAGYDRVSFQLVG